MAGESPMLALVPQLASFPVDRGNLCEAGPSQSHKRRKLGANRCSRMVSRSSRDAVSVQMNRDRFHSLHATAATNALSHGVDIAAVREWLDHANDVNPEKSPILKSA
jgi:hypothetical protein